MRRRQLVQLTAATLAAPSLSAFAQSFPAKPIKLVVAFPAGGPTDITMRSLADNASKVLGQPVVVENKPGAGGTLPAQQLQAAPRRMATPWRRSRWACSACPTPPR